MGAPVARGENLPTTKRIILPCISFEKCCSGINPEKNGVTKMRGARPVVTIESAKKFAERQGYCWIPNPDTDLPYDALAHRDNDAIAIRVRTSRNSPGEFDMWEDFFRDDFEILKMLPMPGEIGRELWVRYVWSRAFQRYRVHEDRLYEISMTDREKTVFQKRVKFRNEPPSFPAIRRDESE
jgi:hypothetical protein